MKRFLSTLALLLCFAFTAVNAQVITAERAAEIANSFFSAGVQKSAVARGVVSSPGLTTSFDSNDVTETASAEPTFYVLANPEGGFVIVSGEETENPIIGYSLDGTIDVNNLPDGFVGYMTDIDAQVKSLREYNANNPQKAAAARSVMQRAANYEYNATTMGNIVKNLNTAPWGQRTPFNKLCPVVGTGNAVTGCVPTAYSILCRYYEWPEQGVGTVYNPSTGDPLQLGHTYDYASMRNDNYPSGYTDAEATAVATLMRDMGYAYTASYGSGTTTTSSENPSNLIKYFGFKCETPLDHGNGCTKYDIVNNMEQWVTYIKNCLNAGYPIPYSSTTALDAQDRHIYILDGYTDNNYFHFNWGWFGSGNGWFTLDNMVPDDYSNYSKSHRAYFNVIPDKTTYTVEATVNDSNMGTVSINGGTAGCSATANLFSGATATLTAHPAQGYALVSWTKNGEIVGSKNTIEVTVGTDANDYVANFDDEANVIVVQDYTINATSGTELTTTKVQEWAFNTNNDYPAALKLISTAASINASNGAIQLFLMDKTSETYTLSVKEDYEITQYTIRCKVPSTSYNIKIVAEGQEITPTTSYADYKFERSNTLARTASNSASFTVTGNSGRHMQVESITVTIAKEGANVPSTPTTYTINVNAETGGNAYVNGTNTSVTVDAGTDVTLQAYPDGTNYTFAGWYNGNSLVSSNNPYTFALNSNVTYTAKFNAVATTCTVTTTANPAEGGTAKFAVGTGSQKTQGDVSNSEVITLYASANTGYTFVNWTLNGNVVGTAATCNVTVSQEANYVANFEAVQQGGSSSTNLAGKYFRLKQKNTTNYMNIYDNNTHGQESRGGVNVTTKNESNDGQIFQFIESGTNYKLLSKTGYYVTWKEWNVNADSKDNGADLTFEPTATELEYLISCAKGYFKIDTDKGTPSLGKFVYSDGAQGAAATWVLEEVVYYTVTARAGEGGSVSPLTSTVEQGKSVTLTATANKGYHFVNWTLNGNVVSTDASYTFNATAAGEYVANFEISTYTISATANPGTAGSVTINGEAVSSKNVNENSAVTLVATPQAGYHFVNWTLNGNMVSTDANYTIDSVTADGEYVANFEEIVVNATLTDAQGNTYNVQLSGFTTGITTATVATKLTAKYPYITLGDNAALNGSNAAYTYTNMVELPFKVSSVSDATKTYWYNIYYPNNGDARNPNYIAALNEDAVVDMAASPEHAYGENPTYNTKAGNPMISWAVYSANNSLEFVFKNELTNNYIKVESVSSSTTNNVKFVENAGDATAFSLLKDATDNYKGDYVLVANTGYLCATSSDEDYVTHFDSNNHEGAWVKFVEVDYGQYIGVLDTKLIKFDVGDDKHMITGEIQPMINALVYDSENITKSQFEAYFDAIDAMDAENWPKLSLTIAPDNSGTTTIAGEEGVTRKYVPTGDLTINATPAEGYHFVSWTSGTNEVSTDANYEFNITAATELTANFAKNSYTVSVTAGEGGSATASATTVEHGGEVTLTADENDGYDFAGWYNGETKVSEANPYTFTVTSDINYEARFEEEAGETPTTHAIHIVTVDTNGNPLTNNATGPVKAVINIGGRDWVTDDDFGHGATADLVATSDFNQSAYLFDGWYKNGEFVSMDSEISVTVTETATYQARFIKGYVVTLASDNKSWGYPNMITYPDGSPVVGAATELKAVVKPNEEVLISINPNYGFRVANWTDKDGNEVAGKNANSFTLKITGDNKYTAHIERATYTLSVSTQQGTMGEVSAKFMENSGTSVVVGHNQPATITASPYTGYRFVEWTTTDGTHVSDEKTYTVPAIENVEDMVDVEYVAIFEESEEVEAGTYYRIAYDFEVPVAAKTAATRAAGDVVNIDLTTGTFEGLVSGEGVRTIYSQWLSANGVRIIAEDKNNNEVTAMRSYNGFQLYINSLESLPIKYTIIVPEGYTLTSMKFKNGARTNDMTVVYGSETYSLKNDATEKTITFTEGNTSFTLSGTVITKNILITALTMTENGSETPEPDTETVRYYVQSDAVSGTNNAMIMRSEDDENYNVASSIFYYADNKLLSYKEGRYLNEGSNNTRGLQNVGVEGGDVEIIDNKIKVSSGTTMVYLHANEDNGTYFVDRCTSKTGDDNGDPEHNFIIEEVTSLPVTITDAGYATWYAPVAVQLPDGLTAYTITIHGDYAITGDGFKQVPANTGVILEGTKGTTYELEIIGSASEVKSIMEGTVAATYFPENDYAYVLSTDKGTRELGFYMADDGEASWSHKAYLPKSAIPAGAQMSAGFRLILPGTTAVENVEMRNEKEEIYDLTGRKLEGISGTGIYIINGKKVLVK